MDWAYTLRKARYIPLRDLGYYLFAFLGNRLNRWSGGGQAFRHWGPLSRELQGVAGRLSPLEVAGLQWKNCVDLAEEALDRIDPDRQLRIHYEQLVADPSAPV